jgi:hypothetical protein
MEIATGQGDEKYDEESGKQGLDLPELGVQPLAHGVPPDQRRAGQALIDLPRKRSFMVGPAA